MVQPPVILARANISEGLKLAGMGVNAMSLRAGIEESFAKVVAILGTNCQAYKKIKKK